MKATASRVGNAVTIAGGSGQNYFKAFVESGKVRIRRNGGIVAGDGFTQIDEDTVELQGPVDGLSVVFDGGQQEDWLDQDIGGDGFGDFFTPGNGDPFKGCTSLTLSFSGTGHHDVWQLTYYGAPLVTLRDVSGTRQMENYVLHYNL